MKGEGVGGGGGAGAGDANRVESRCHQRPPDPPSLEQDRDKCGGEKWP